MPTKIRRRCTFRPQLEPLEDRNLLALVITPTFDPSINSDPSAAAIKATINTAIAAYKATFADNVTVNITFKKDLTISLGSSLTQPLTVSYSSYRTALTSHSKTTDDKTAVTSLQSSTTNPVPGGGANIVIASALARALGLSRTSPAVDSTISLNTSVCNLDRTSTDSTKYDLLGVTCHEIDEALTLGSGLDGLHNGDAAPANIDALDLFRFDQTGARSYNTPAATQAFFSINGGTTKLAQFNQTAGGDFSDWYSPGGQTPQIQDAVGTPGATPNLGVELVRLDVLGFNRVNTAGPVVTSPGAQVDVPGNATSFSLGSFTGGNGPWSVDVDWGDGSAHTTFNVTATGSLGNKTHTYAAGPFSPKVTVTDLTGVAGTATFTVADTTTSISIDTSNNLVVQDAIAAGKNDYITIQADTANSQYILTDPSASSAFGLMGTVLGATISADRHTAYVPFAAFSGSQIDVQTLAGNDSLTIDVSLGAFPKSINYDGGAGTNTLVGPNADRTWNLTAANAGNIVDAAFANVQNLTGGSGRDVFSVVGAAKVGGKINGGTGSNWLDYSSVAFSVMQALLGHAERLSVNLTNGAAFRVTGGVAGINNVIGTASGGDSLTGSPAGGMLVARGTGNTLRAGAGRSILIGGFGINSLVGGAADDVLINGRTSYDGNISTLDAIRTIWQGGQTFVQRMAALSSAGPNQLKVGTTVFLAPSRTANGAGPRYGRGGFVYGSTMIGNAGSNWFFTLNVSGVTDHKASDAITSL